ncbi:MAG: DUF1858 domain-containing protein, partial [Clostridia bacterium]
DMLIADLLQIDGNIEAVINTLMSSGMHCLGCAMSHGETIEEAAGVHGVEIDELIERIKAAAVSE